MTTLDGSEPEALARAWMAVDPDPETRAETAQILDIGGEMLTERFGTHLEFGTAGLRGRLGTGPNRMNRVIVRLVAAAIADDLTGEADPHVVIGYDARHGSADFASDTARVMLARGVRCTILPRPLPTPVLAFTVRHLRASAGVMVTASHNPRDDNGYKVYWRGGALLTSPLDTRIAGAMTRLPLLGDLDLVPVTDPDLAPAPESLVDAYIETVVGTLDPAGSRSTKIVHTALHGVGTEMIERAFTAAGFPTPKVVAAQSEPDPDFPTAPFPNPEEPGTLDLLRALGDLVSADLALANDPDADRLAVVVPTGGGWQQLSGDDVGCLLADHLLRRATDDDRLALVITTITSSRLLSRIADVHDADHVETLTGFKWIMHARHEREDHRFVCGYEEALGYAVSDEVRDKDGVSAALVIAELAGELKDQGKTLLDRLDELHERHGIHVTGQRAIRFEPIDDGPAQGLAMHRLRAAPPRSLAGVDVIAVHDLATGDTGLPPTDGLVLELDAARIVIRPSGTEPKMKVYGEVVAPANDDIGASRRDARERLRRIVDAAVLTACSLRPDATPAGVGSTRDAAALFASHPTGAARVTDLELIVRCIDLTTLEGDDSAERVRSLSAKARRPDVADPSAGPVAAVCVYPAFVPLVAALLGGTTIATASVAGAFPSGLSALDVRLADIDDAVGRGADEVDIVINRSALLDGRLDDVAAELAASRAAAGDAHLKVILEVGELGTAGPIRLASRLAMDAGADFIKTSTGKANVNGTPAAVLTMAEEIRRHADETDRRVGIKIAGGVRTATDALGYVSIVRAVLGEEWVHPGLLRFGACSLLDDVVAELDRARSASR